MPAARDSYNIRNLSHPGRQPFIFHEAIIRELERDLWFYKSWEWLAFKIKKFWLFLSTSFVQPSKPSGSSFLHVVVLLESFSRGVKVRTFYSCSDQGEEIQGCELPHQAEPGSKPPGLLEVLGFFFTLFFRFDLPIHFIVPRIGFRLGSWRAGLWSAFFFFDLDINVNFSSFQIPFPLNIILPPSFYHSPFTTVLLPLSFYHCHNHSALHSSHPHHLYADQLSNMEPLPRIRTSRGPVTMACYNAYAQICARQM